MNDAPGAATLADASGNGRHCTLGPNVTMVAGRFGNAASFDGTGGAWASFASPLMTNMTLSAWVFMDGIPTNILPRILQIGADTYYLMPSNRMGTFSFGCRGNNWSSSANDPFKFVTNRWFHAAIVYRQEYTNTTDRVVATTFYLNGLRCGDPVRKAYSNDIPATTAFLGNNSFGSGGVRPLNGMLDDVRLYDTPLSDKDVLALYQNIPPSADAGPDQTCYRDATRLQGRLTCTNSFMRDLATATAWSVVSAPPGATPAIAIPHILDTDATLSAPGAYVFRLSASNAFGIVSDDVTVTRAAGDPHPGNVAPSVTPSWNATGCVLGASAPLAATVTDDGNPSPARLRWTKVSGPGAVFFDNPFTNATAAFFSTNGTYVVRLTADDGAASDSDDITVTVASPVGNLFSGIEHWWRLNDDPASRKAFDSAAANTLSLTNQAFLQPGKSGYGYRGPKLDAVGVAATLPTNAETMTFCAWFYHDDAYVHQASGNRYQRLFNCGPNFYILYDPVVRQITLSTRGVGTGNTQHTWSWPNLFTSNQWYHVSILFDRRHAASGSRQVMYINGQKALSNPYNTAFPGAEPFTSPFIVANGSVTGGTRNFDGVLDELRVYSRFITDEEALLLAADPDNNHAPAVEAPATLTVRVGRPVLLSGSVTDDGQPLGQELTAAWSVTSGNPAHVAFADASTPATTATFSHTGEYVIMLSATDGSTSAAALTRVTAVPTGSVICIQ